MERTLLDEHGRHGTAGRIQLRLDDEAAGCSLRVSFQFLHVSDQKDHFQQVLNAVAALRGNRYEDVRAAPFLADQAVFGQFLLDLVDVGAGLIDLVDGNNDLNAGCLRMVDGFDGLRHDAVVGCHDQDRDIGRLGAAHTHGGEGFVAGGIQEGDLPAVDLDHVCTDVLRDAAGFAGGDVGLADRIQQGCLAVVDVAHDADHRRSGHHVLFLVLNGILEEFSDDVDGLFLLGNDIKIEGDICRGIVIQILVDGIDLALQEELLDDGSGLHLHGIRQFLERQLLGDRDRLDLRFLRLGLRFLGQAVQILDALALGSLAARTPQFTGIALVVAGIRGLAAALLRAGLFGVLSVLGQAEAAEIGSAAAGTGRFAGTCSGRAARSLIVVLIFHEALAAGRAGALAVSVAGALEGPGTAGMVGTGLAVRILRIGTASGLAVASLSPLACSGRTASFGAGAGAVFRSFAAFLLLAGQAFGAVLGFLFGLADLAHIDKAADRLRRFFGLGGFRFGSLGLRRFHLFCRSFRFLRRLSCGFLRSRFRLGSLCRLSRLHCRFSGLGSLFGRLGLCRFRSLRSRLCRSLCRSFCRLYGLFRRLLHLSSRLRRRRSLYGLFHRLLGRLFGSRDSRFFRRRSSRTGRCGRSCRRLRSSGSARSRPGRSRSPGSRPCRS